MSKTNKYTECSPTLKDILGCTISREAALTLVKSSPDIYEIFLGFPQKYQEQVLEFIQGNRGLPILYDGFFKSIMNPFSTPERLENFLSCLLGQSVTIIDVLTREGSQLTEQGSLVIMDIIVQIEDGSYVDVEMQKYGYEFTGERSTCYISDLIMRQYNRVKSQKNKNFSFKDMKPVYLIVLMEHSSKPFLNVSPYYIHRLNHVFDSGAKINLLTNCIYISLDTFHSVSQNIDTELDAWLTFLSSDQPEDIIHLVKKYPQFADYYHDIALFRQNPKELMNMFSEALLQMDKNTATYMIEELEEQLLKKDYELAEKDEEIKKLKELLASQNK